MSNEKIQKLCKWNENLETRSSSLCFEVSGNKIPHRTTSLGKLMIDDLHMDNPLKANDQGMKKIISDKVSWQKMFCSHNQNHSENAKESYVLKRYFQ